MLVRRAKEKKVFWEFDSIIMQNMSHNLLLFCAPTWPSYRVIENHSITRSTLCAIQIIALKFPPNWTAQAAVSSSISFSVDCTITQSKPKGKRYCETQSIHFACHYSSSNSRQLEASSNHWRLQYPGVLHCSFGQPLHTTALHWGHNL